MEKSSTRTAMPFRFLMVQNTRQGETLKDKLTISGLSSPLKAEKRAELAQKLAGVADIHFETELKIGRVRNNASKEQTSETWSLNDERLDSPMSGFA